MGQNLTLTSPDGHSFSAYRADPAGTPKGAIVVIQEIFGVNSHIRSVTDRFAKAPALWNCRQLPQKRGLHPALAEGHARELGMASSISKTASCWTSRMCRHSATKWTL